MPPPGGAKNPLINYPPYTPYPMILGGGMGVGKLLGKVLDRGCPERLQLNRNLDVDGTRISRRLDSGNPVQITRL
jgi:hypothetical protein